MELELSSRQPGVTAVAWYRPEAGTSVFFAKQARTREGPNFEVPDLTTAHKLQNQGEIRFLTPPLPVDKAKMRLDGGHMASRVGPRDPPETMVTITKVTLRARHSPQMLS